MADFGFQLYSARKYPLADVLQTLSQLGYKHVEGYGGLDPASASGFGGIYADLQGLKAQLDANGLTMPTAHVGLDLLQAPDKAIELARTLDIETLICPWLAPDKRPTNAQGWRAFGEELARTAKPITEAGLTFGYHNHDFEFALTEDGQYPMDILLETAPDIRAEADIAWIFRGKADAFAWLEKQGSRIVAVHVKDVAPAGENADEDGWADVGHGTLPWSELLQTVRQETSAKYFVAEHDNPNDVTRFATRAIAAFNGFGE